MDKNSTEIVMDGNATVGADQDLEAEDNLSFIPKESTAAVMEFQEGRSSSAAATTFVASALAAASVVAAAGMMFVGY